MAFPAPRRNSHGTPGPPWVPPLTPPRPVPPWTVHRPVRPPSPSAGGFVSPPPPELAPRFFARSPAFPSLAGCPLTGPRMYSNPTPFFTRDPRRKFP